MSDLTKHIDELVANYDKFRSSLNGHYLNAVSEEIEWLRSYVKDEKEKIANARQIKIDFK